MTKRIKIDGLADAVSDALNEYSGYVSAETKEIIRNAGKTAAKELRRTSPKDTGEYAKSWKSKVTSETARTIHVSVYADHHQYSLTHLLENGHAKRGGGRVAAIPHIEPVNDEILDQIEKEIDRAL
ncbi:MAG TPA: HK97 gp10 family phage protein [Candidatus Copromonas avistercoris]|nr:HK97 gp10 family phage protein [Candidatus Copromonas avistercoris]